MRALAVAVAMIGATPAHAQWSDVEGGTRHDMSGLVCPSEAGGFELKTKVAGATGFSCRYSLRCRADEGCENAVGFAAVTWNPSFDFDAQFRSLVAQQKLAIVDEPGPAWASPPLLFARAGEGLETGYAGWWQITAQGKPLNIAVFYNAPAEAAANTLVGTTALLNP